MKEAIGEALQQHARGEPITASCPTCGRTLEVADVAVTGALVVACPERGHLYVRFKRAPAPPGSVP
jgi:hypothetical protein